MQVQQILSIIYSRTKLNNDEVKEVENSFSDMLNLSILKLLGSDLTQTQKEGYLSAIKELEENKNPQKIISVLIDAGIDKARTEKYLETATRDSLKQIISALKYRLTEKDFEELSRLIGYRV